MKTFFTLLQIFSAELERTAGEDADNTSTASASKKISVVARRVLPALRHYSSWLLCVYDDLLMAAQKGANESPLAVQIRELWEVYANALTLLTSSFDVVHLPEIDYLLEEDEETLGFAPLAKDATSRRYLDAANGVQKWRMDDGGVGGVERSHPSVEMLYRIRELVIDGLDLVVGNKIPIVLVDNETGKSFVYRESGLPLHPSIHHPLASTNIENEDVQQQQEHPNSTTADTRSTVDYSSVSADMYRIVEGVERLVDSDVNDAAPAFLDGSGRPPTPQQQARSFNGGAATPFHQNAAVDRSGTPSAAGRLFFPDGGHQPLFPQAYAPRPALPAIQRSIWNTNFPSQVTAADHIPSPRTPPGLSQQGPLGPSNSAFQSPSEPPDLVATNRRTVSSFINPIASSGAGATAFGGPSSSSSRSLSHSWLQSNNNNQTLFPAPRYDQVMDRFDIPLGSGNSNMSYANNAFIASSSVSSGMGYPTSSASLGLGMDSAFDNGAATRRTVSQLGAIGQAPYGPGV